MNPPPISRPAYLGLYVSLVLALTCNTFLDIQYGSFGFEVGFWAVVQGWTLLIGWKEAVHADGAGARQQRVVLVIGLALSFLVLIPKWGFPRAGIYMLAFLQAAMNCVTTTRRQLYFGLLVSLVMVMFAASHYRADWTMLFYLVPYVIAVVFTMVSEQVGGRIHSLRQVGVGQPAPTGVGVAISAATGMILVTGLVAYLLTPQLTWPYLEWRYGQLSNIGFLGQPKLDGRLGRGGAQAGGQGTSGQGDGGGSAGGDAGAPDGQASGAGGGQGKGENKGSGQGHGEGSGYEPSPGQGWPSPAEIRKAAGRTGMPDWQSGALVQLADLDDAIQQALAPIKEVLEDLWNTFKQWLQEHRALLWRLLLAIGLLALLTLAVLALWAFNATTWVRTRFDYLWFALLGAHRRGPAGARQYYSAMERLFALKDLPRAPQTNTREYLQIIWDVASPIQPEIKELTELLECYRYGAVPPDAAQLRRMREVYCDLYEKFA